MTSQSEESSSLQIAEPEVPLLVDHSHSRETQQTQEQPEGDLFELSRDEPTLSFAIEPQPLPQVVPPPAVAPQNHRKRKEIFEKFKRPVANREASGTEGGSERLLNIFDSIFNGNCGAPQLQKKTEQATQMKGSSIRSRTPSTEKKERMKIFAGRDRSDSKKLLPSNILQENYSMHSVQGQDKRQEPPESDKSSSGRESMTLSGIERRWSGIEGQKHFEESRDSLQIHEMLETEIFKEDNKPPSPIRKGNKSPSPAKNVTKQTEQCTETGNQFRGSMSQVSTGSVMTLQNYRDSQAFDPKSSMANIPDTPIQDLMGVAAESPKRTAAFAKKKQPQKAEMWESQVQEFQPVPTLCAQPTIEISERMPQFLRLVRRQIGTYPNLWWQGDHRNVGTVREELFQLLSLVGQAVGVLSHFCQKVLQAKSKVNLYTNQLLNNPTVADFTQLGWEKVVTLSDYEPIRPRQGFERRNWDYDRAKKALVNYQSIVDYYRNKKFSIDIGSEQGRVKYFDIRRKFWDICGNLKLISEDIYSQMLSCLFPIHYYEILTYLRQPSQSLNQIKHLLNSIRHLQLQHDPLARSEIGREVEAALSAQLRLRRPL